MKIFSNALSSALPSLIFSINALTKLTSFSATVLVVEKPNTWVNAVPIGLSIVPSDWKLISSNSSIFCLPPRSTNAWANSVALLPTAPKVSAAILPHLVQNWVTSSLPAWPIKVSQKRAQELVTWSATASDTSPRVWNSEAILTKVSSSASVFNDWIRTSFVNQPCCNELRKPSDISTSWPRACAVWTKISLNFWVARPAFSTETQFWVFILPICKACCTPNCNERLKPSVVAPAEAAKLPQPFKAVLASLRPTPAFTNWANELCICLTEYLVVSA